MFCFRLWDLPAVEFLSTVLINAPTEPLFVIYSLAAPVIGGCFEDMMDEDRIISDMLAKQHRRKSSKATVYPDEVSDMETAILRAAAESASLISDWTSPESKYVGCLCRVYWEGDLEWYEARILNYNCRSNKHCLFYPMDNTFEWVDLSKEASCIGYELVLAKWGSMMWPALCYHVNEAAIPLLPVKFDPRTGTVPLRRSSVRPASVQALCLQVLCIGFLSCL